MRLHIDGQRAMASWVHGLTSLPWQAATVATLFAAALAQAQPPEVALYPQAAAEYSRWRGGSAVLVADRRGIVFEDYHNGAGPNTAPHIQSATKAFWAAAFAIAFEQGWMTLDEPLADTITEWRDTPKAAIRVVDLLELSSGLEQAVEYIQGLNPKADDIYQYVVDELRLVTPSGYHFQYGPSHYYAFGVLLERKLQGAGYSGDPLQFLQQWVLDEIQLFPVHWVRDDVGNPHIPNGAHMTARDMAKYGMLLLNQGRHNDKVLFSPETLSLLLDPAPTNPGHGKFLWLNTPGGRGGFDFQQAPPFACGGFIYHHGFDDMFAALGAGKNRLYVIPSIGLVVVRQSLGDYYDTPDPRAFVDNDFLTRLFQGPRGTRAQNLNPIAAEPTTAEDSNGQPTRRCFNDDFLSDR
ncbi:MAG: serine hydrolase domain-containing protein [Candidatus Competibacterales bacterium]